MSQSTVRVGLEITEGLTIAVKPREDTPLVRTCREEWGAFHFLFRCESFMLREARLCTQNTTSIAVMLHFATFMFWLERRPFSCQCMFPKTQRGEEHATNADASEASANNPHNKGRECFRDFTVQFFPIKTLNSAKDVKSNQTYLHV